MKKIARLLLLLLFGFLLVSGCASDKKELPNTPEKVARQWQNWIDNNKFQEARELSTTNAIDWINWAEETIAASGEANEMLAPAIFISMSCTEQVDRAICGYVMNDEGFEYRDSFYLQKVNGQWLVDIPEEDLIEDDGLKELFENMEKEREEIDSE